MTGVAREQQTGFDFDALVREYQSMVFSICLHFLHDREAAEETAQETFLSLHRHMADIESREHAGFWLKKVAVQRAIDEGRKQKRRPRVALEAVPEPVAAIPMADPMLGSVLRRMVNSLAETPRAVMILRYQEDLDPADIAELLDMPVATVKSHLQRSLALLREKLGRRGIGEA